MLNLFLGFVLSARISLEEIPPRAPNFMCFSSPVNLLVLSKSACQSLNLKVPASKLTKIYSCNCHPAVQYQTVNNLYVYISQNKSCWKLLRLNGHEPKARSAITNASQKISELIENHHPSTDNPMPSHNPPVRSPGRTGVWLAWKKGVLASQIMAQ